MLFQKKVSRPLLNRPDRLFTGTKFRSPLPGGRSAPFVNFDHAATTPPLRSVMEHVNRCTEWYSSVHRGAGYKSMLTTQAYQTARESLGRFFGMDPDYHALLFCSNTTDAVNRVAALFNRDSSASGNVILCSIMEHHSNLLPWAGDNLHVDHIRAKWPCGMLDLDHLEEQLRKYAGRVRLVCVTGASNITGLVPPIAEIAALAHEHGARILVDAAQLVAHRPICMGKAGSPFCIDFLMFSGHKMYAPFGSGGLIVPRDCYTRGGAPFVKGGGAVHFVELDRVEWAGLPNREEAGTPNVLGVLAMAKAAETLAEIGMDAVARHEIELLRRLRTGLRAIPEITVFGGCDEIDDLRRVAVLPLQSSRYPHAHLAAILGHEWGIGVRNGCFCAQPYANHLLQVSPDDRAKHFELMKQGDRTAMPGFVRISIGLPNTEKDIDRLLLALKTIHTKGPTLSYRLDRSGEYQPENPPAQPKSFLRSAGFLSA